MVNLEQLRKQAKELVRAARAGDAEALARLEGREPILARAQLVVAREHGYASWPALVAAVEANAESFVLAATNRQRTRAESLLAARPELGDDPWAKLVLGRGWDGDPNEPGGPRGWAPLLYVCHSCFPSATLARELLSRGADPNVTFDNEYGAMSALYGAAGVAHDPELTRVLLEAGANPDDGESVYHSTEAQSTECLRLLLEHGAQTKDTNALAHALDEERLEHVRLLLEAGADPNEWAIRRACRAPRPRARVRPPARRARRRPRPPGRRDVARERAAADAVSARRPAWPRRHRGGSRRARRLDRARSRRRSRRGPWRAASDRRRELPDDARSRSAGGRRARGAARAPGRRRRHGRARLPWCRGRLARGLAAPPRGLDRAPRRS